MIARWLHLCAPVLLCALVACDRPQISERPPNEAAAATPVRVQTSRQPLGEVVGGFPSDQERMVHVLTNLARHASKNMCGDWSQQFPDSNRVPLVYSHIGNKAARRTSELMAENSCFQHDTCCVLAESGGSVVCTAPATCSGQACNRTCTGGTPTAQRYSMLGFSSWSGENIARGYPTGYDAWCGWMNSETGHRENIYSNHSELGVGLFASNDCGAEWTQAFGSGNVTVPRIPAASAMHGRPNPNDAAALSFAANYYEPLSGQPAGGAPRRAAVVVGGHCFDLTKEWGHDGNGTYTVKFSQPDDIPVGCHPYYFMFVDSDAARHTYPDQGSLFVAIGKDQMCPKPYDVGQLPADCETGVQTCIEGAVQDCYTGPQGTEGVGVCRGGYQVCRNGFWSSCRDQKFPGTEVCDGLDNDCNGAADDGAIQDVGQSCTVPGERGICTAGARQCRGGAIVCEGTTSPQVELCDGIDNDCDGVVDDGLGVQSCGKGDCFRMVPQCVNGQEQTCVPGAADVEVADARDNDCDGVVDNGIDCRKADGGFGHVQLCYSFPVRDADGGSIPLISPCTKGVQACGEDGQWGTCAGEQGPSAEVCDGKDNDCDGDTDENDELGWQRCGVGGCTAWSQVCKEGKANACVPATAQAETCDGVDNSCDGTIDEGCACRSGVAVACYSGPRQSLDAGTCQEGLNTCVAGQWSGCQGESVPSQELCDGADNDCDGVADDACVEPPDAGTDAGGVIGPRDAGMVDAPDAGSDTPGGEPGCGCSSGGTGALVPFAFLSFALRVRWRRRGVKRAEAGAIAAG